MAVLINFKICDNAQECNGIAVCPTGALSWDKKKKKIIINNKKCTSCAKCEQACEVDAIRVGKTEKAYNKIKKEIDRDPRRVSDLFTERYGAQPICSPFFVSKEDFDVHILKANKLTVVEFFSNDSIKCLLYSIPVRELFEGFDIKYRKMEVKNSDIILRKYSISRLPALLFFKSGKLIGKIQGYYNKEEKEKILKKISKIIG